jgi:S1-C subfamily serine protease
MNRFRTYLLVLGALMLFGLSNLALASPADDKEKQKPKDAPTLDDSTCMLTEYKDGNETTKKLDLKCALNVKGYFDNDGFNIQHVEDNGPATKLTSSSGETMKLEKGDIITEIDGHKIKSADDYVQAMNGASDPEKIKIKVKDVNSGKEQDFTVAAKKL